MYAVTFGEHCMVTPPTALTREYPHDGICRILSLDGGGAKGFYTLGVLKEIEAMLDCRLYRRFDLVFGTSTGAIIAALVALGHTVDEIHDLYKRHVPTVMREKKPHLRTRALERLVHEVFGNRTFEDVKTGVGIVATRWLNERPMIFKKSIGQAHGLKSTFTPGFGVSIADAVQGSCSAYPFFDRKHVKTAAGDDVELIDGGYCANNPTLYAIADAIVALENERKNVRVLNIGVGVYPEPKGRFVMRMKKKYVLSIRLLQKTLEINTQSMDQLRHILFRDIPTIRISDTFQQPEMATDLMEHDLSKLNVLRQRGRDSFASRQAQLEDFLR
jgi:uncharacterized protein